MPAYNLSGLPRPIIRLNYKGIPIYDEVRTLVTDLTWTDNLEDQADEIDLKLNNGSSLFFDPWFPESGDELEGAAGYANGPMVDIGLYYMDQPNASGGRGGDMFSMKGKSVPVKKDIGTKKTREFENKTVGEIAAQVAKDHGLTVVGTPPDTKFERITQRRETDLGFLQRLSRDYGAFFSVKGKQLVFMPRSEVWARKPVMIFMRGQREIIDYNLRHETSKTYSKAKVSYFEGNQKKNISVDVEDKTVQSGDTLKIDDRVENEGQAKKLAKSRLDKANAKQWSGTLQVVGDPVLAAGQVIELAGYGRWDRRYTIKSARHHDTRQGYTTSMELEGVRE